MKEVSPAFLASICGEETFEMVQCWVNRFNAGMNTHVPGAAVVLEMNKRGANIPFEFKHQLNETSTIVSPGEIKNGKIELIARTTISVMVPIDDELAIEDIAKQICEANNTSIESLIKPPKSKKNIKSGRRLRTWSTDDDKLVMSTDIPMGELTEALNRTAPAIYSRRTNLRKMSTT